jgi:hypothetical protein
LRERVAVLKSVTAPIMAVMSFDTVSRKSMAFARSNGIM